MENVMETNGDHPWIAGEGYGAQRSKMKTKWGVCEKEPRLLKDR